MGSGKISNLDKIGSQMPQLSYSPVDLPYIFIGLGRTNNYVENFVMGISTKYGSSSTSVKWRIVFFVKN